MLVAARERALELNLEFDLREEDIVIPDICPVLGIPLVIGRGRATDASPSIDRMDPTKGYTRGNICVISWKANRLKSNATLDDMEKVLTYMRLIQAAHSKVA